MIVKKSIYENYLPTLLWIIISFIPAIIGGYFKPGSWYLEIAKPDWTPPGWVFGPVWFLLYFCMGISASIIWKSKNNKPIKLAMTIFIVQLILNALWSWVFFGLNNLLFSVVEIILLLSMIVLTIFLFYRINKKAGLILIPYLLWVSFATILNLNIWLLNR